jgi:CMP-N,N'-diacetyllegionaminic acid synthase
MSAKKPESVPPRILCVIPARGGSKGLPGKNAKPLFGRPLVGWTIRAALDCGVPMRVVVSTDDARIADAARAEGAGIVDRPPELATDRSPTVDAVLHAMDVLLRSEGFEPDLVLLLQATSPLRGAQVVAEALERILSTTDCDGLVSVVRESHPPWWLKTIDARGRLADLIPYDRMSFTRRQDFPPVYRLNGALYACRPESLARTRDFLAGSILAFPMTEEDSIDIDVEADFVAAEAVLRRRAEQGKGDGR